MRISIPLFVFLAFFGGPARAQVVVPDEYPTIQDAIDNNATGNLEITVKAGDYEGFYAHIYSTGAHPDLTSLTVKGENATGTNIIGTGYSNRVIHYSCPSTKHPIVLENLHVSGSDNGIIGIDLNRPSSATLEKCTIDGISGAGLRIEESDYVELIDVKVTNISYHAGTSVPESAAYLYAIDMILADIFHVENTSRSGGTFHGAHLTLCDYVDIYNGKFLNNAAGTGLRIRDMRDPFDSLYLTAIDANGNGEHGVAVIYCINCPIWIEDIDAANNEEQGLRVSHTCDAPWTVAYDLFIDGGELNNNTENGLFVNWGNSVALKNLNIHHNQYDETPGYEPSNQGGGAKVSCGNCIDDVEIDGIILDHNMGRSGGGMHVYSDGYIIINNLTATNNKAIGAAVTGGGVYAEAKDDFEIFSSTFDNNEAVKDGGGLHLEYGGNDWATVCGTTFSNNKTQETGGALAAFSSSFNSPGSLSVSNCSFTGNTADFGAAVATWQNCLTHMKNCQLNSNTEVTGTSERSATLWTSNKAKLVATTLQNNTTDNEIEAVNALYFGYPAVVDATHTYWGTTDLAAIEDRVWHDHDNVNLHRVHTWPPLESPPNAANAGCFFITCDGVEFPTEFEARKTDGSAKDPVCTATGEFYKEFMDLDLDGPLPLVFKRYYGSFLGENGLTESALGANWMHNFDVRLVTDDDEMTVVLFGGRTVQFFKTATGDWLCQNAENATYQLMTSGADTLFLEPFDEWVYRFDAAGKLTGIMDRSGNLLTVTQGADGPSSVADGLGRTLSFTYSGGQLSSVQDHGGRSIDFTHTGDNLTGSQDPMGFETTYAYTTVDGHAALMTGFTRPETNTPITNNYNDDLQVSYQDDAESNRTTFTYDSGSGETGVTRIRDAEFNYTDHTHLSRRSLSDIRDDNGNHITISNDLRMRRTGVVDRFAQTTAVTYDATSSFVESVTNASGATISYTYTPVVQNVGGADFTFHELTRIDYPDSTYETFTYDGAGHITAFRDRGGEVYGYTHNGMGQVETFTNPAGGIVTYTYNADGTMASRSANIYGVTAFGYDGLNRLTQVNHPDTTFRSWTFDDNDRITSWTDERGLLFDFDYDQNGNLVTVTDPDLLTVGFVYDDMDRMIEHTNRSGKTTTYTYDDAGRLATVTDPNLFEVQYEYDNLGRLLQVTDPENKVFSFEHDLEGVPESFTTPLNHTTELMSDDNGHITGVRQPGGQEVTATLDAMGRATQTVDPLGRMTHYTYHPLGVLESVTKPGLGSLSLVRNSLGLPTGINDFRNQIWQFDYNVLGDLTQTQDPLGQTTTYAYDDCGRVDLITHEDGATISMTHDAAGNVTRRLYSIDGTDLNFTYDAQNRITHAENVDVIYDPEGQVTDTQTRGRSFAATYDHAGRLETLVYDTALTVGYLYDKRGLVTQVSDDLTGTVVTFTYDDNGRLTDIVRPNGMDTILTWDDRSALTRLQHVGVVDLMLTTNAAGEITQVTGTPALELADVLGSLSDHWTYDAAGQIDSMGFAYDTCGRMVSGGGRTLTWDGASRLIQSNGVTLDYNGMGCLIGRTEGGELTELYPNFALPQNLCMAERSQSSATWTAFYVYTPYGELLYRIDPASGNAVSYYHFDQTGNTLCLTNAAASVTDRYAYTPYGIMYQTGPSLQPYTFGGAFGVRRLDNQGLYLMGARTYDAQLARFTSREPIWPRLAVPGATNPYQFALGDPVSVSDPLGTKEKMPPAKVWWRWEKTIKSAEDFYDRPSRRHLGNRQAAKKALEKYLDRYRKKKQQETARKFLKWLRRNDPCVLICQRERARHDKRGDWYWYEYIDDVAITALGTQATLSEFIGGAQAAGETLATAYKISEHEKAMAKKLTDRRMRRQGLVDYDKYSVDRGRYASDLKNFVKDAKDNNSWWYRTFVEGDDWTPLEKEENPNEECDCFTMPESIRKMFEGH